MDDPCLSVTRHRLYGIVCNLFQPVGSPATPSNRLRRLQAVSPTELVESDVIDADVFDLLSFGSGVTFSAGTTTSYTSGSEST